MIKIRSIIILEEVFLVYLSASRYLTLVLYRRNSTVFIQFLEISARIHSLSYTTFLYLKKHYIVESIYRPGEKRNKRKGEKSIQEKKRQWEFTDKEGWNLTG